MDALDNVPSRQLRVALIQTPLWNINQPPIAIALLTGNLRSRGFVVFPKDIEIAFYHHVDASDKALWQDLRDDFSSYDCKVDSLIKKYGQFVDDCARTILNDQPDVVGFSMQLRASRFSLYLAKLIKTMNPQVYIIFGGPEAYKGVEAYLRPYDFIDAICMGEGDIAFPAFLESFKQNKRPFAITPGFAYRDENGSIVDGGISTVLPLSEHIPFVDYSDVDFLKYGAPNTVNMLMSKGCINRCSFCNESPVTRKHRTFPAERVFNEIIHMSQTCNVQSPMNIAFQDSLINGDLNELEKFADLLNSRPHVPLTYTGMMLVRKQMTPGLVEKLSKSGLRQTWFGVESGSEVVLKLMRKNFGPQDAMRIIELFSKAGINVGVFIIVGHPGETEEEFYRSINVARRLAKHATYFSVNLLTLLENSDLIHNKSKYGIIDSEAGWLSDNGQNTPWIRKQRQLIGRALLGDKAYSMGDTDPLDPDSADYYYPFSSHPPARQTAVAESNMPDELAQIKSSVYFKVYDRLKKRRHLRFVSTAVIKPSIRFSWKVLRNSRRFVKRFMF